MKRLATTILLVVALATATSSFGQAQRWEYATLHFMMKAEVIMFTETAVSLSVIGFDSAARESLAQKLVERYGEPPGLVPGRGYSEVIFLSLIGYGGWELVSTVTTEIGDRVHFFKRPLP